MFSSVSRPPSKTTKAWCLQALFFFFSPRVSRALLLKLPIISDMQSTYVPWISQAFSLSLHQEESSIDSNFSLSSWAWTEARERSWERGWRDMRQLKTGKCLSGRKIYVGNYGDHSFRENLEMFFSTPHVKKKF